MMNCSRVPVNKYMFIPYEWVNTSDNRSGEAHLLKDSAHHKSLRPVTGGWTEAAKVEGKTNIVLLIGVCGVV